MGFIVSRSPLSPALDVFQHELGGGRRNLRSSPSNGKSSLVVAPACEPLDIDLPLQFRNLRARRIDDRTPIRRETEVVDVGSRLRKLLGNRAIHVREPEDRKRDGKGKSGSLRVDIVGRWVIHKKKHSTTDLPN